MVMPRSTVLSQKKAQGVSPVPGPFGTDSSTEGNTEMYSYSKDDNTNLEKNVTSRPLPATPEHSQVLETDSFQSSLSNSQKLMTKARKLVLLNNQAAAAKTNL
jgi:hypothetical protein